MKTLEEIKNILSKHKEDLKIKYGMDKIGIFGSYVRSEQKGTSDIDILVEFADDASIGLLEFVNMENYLSDLLKMKVDLVEKPAVKPRIAKQILNEVIYL